MSGISRYGRVKISKRLTLFFGILALGMLACIHGIGLILWYPVGIMVALNFFSGGKMDGDSVIGMGYGIYAILLISFLVCSKPRTVKWLIIIMIIVTVLNVAGCHHVLSELSNI